MIQNTGTLFAVDGNMSIVGALQEALTQAGYTSTVATTGEETVGAIDGQDIDVIVLDLSLRDVSWREALDQLQIRNPIISVIIVTAVRVLLATKGIIRSFTLNRDPLHSDVIVLNKALTKHLTEVRTSVRT